ncbi:MAG: hypothetical protein K8F36_04995 [Melioribacteraceae bacterium]|nr:hypothetical protein [Melioribacteraceae bacterium]
MKTILILIIASTSIFGSVSLDSVDNKILNYTYNNETSKAAQLISERIKKYPGNPKYYFLELGNDIMHSIVLVNGAAAERKFQVRDSLNNLAIEKAEKYLDMFEDNAETLEDKFYVGGFHGYLARFYGLDRSYMSAFSSAKSGQRIMEDILEENPDFNDAYLLLGMSYYFADRLSGFIGFVAGILGLSGDRDKGIDYIKRAADKGELSFAQAAISLVEIYTRLEDNEYPAFPYFEKFLKKFPNSSYMINWYCRELLDLNMTERVEMFIETDSLNLVDDIVKQRYHFAIGNYEVSEKYWQKIEKEKSVYWRWFYDQASFTNTLNSVMIEGKAPSVDESLGDNYKDLLSGILKNTIELKQYIEFQSAINRNQQVDIEQSLNSLNSSEVKSAVRLNYGIYLINGKKFNEAEPFFDEIRKSQLQLFNYMGCKFLGVIYTNIDVDREKAENLLDEIEDKEYERIEFAASEMIKKYDL